jgi:hypothetical protein
LKEYEFELPSTPIEVKDGDHLEKVLTAKRVAFSAFGSVTMING